VYERNKSKSHCTRLVAHGVNDLHVQGNTGSTGATGMHGDKGQMGHIGATGYTGPRGPTGPVGDDNTIKGEVGVSGDNGSRGEDGATGGRGSQGQSGDTGPQGSAGDNYTVVLYGPYHYSTDDGETTLNHQESGPKSNFINKLY